VPVARTLTAGRYIWIGIGYSVKYNPLLMRLIACSFHIAKLIPNIRSLRVKTLEHAKRYI